MSKLIKDDAWVWIVVQDPGGNEQFLGQHDDEMDISFIPVFLEKDEAEECLKYLARDGNLVYEVQAISYQILAKHATDNDFLIFLLNRDGQVLEKIEF